jgi:hypothetical protein
MSQWFTEEWIDLKGTYFQPKAFRKSARKIRETVESVETLVSSWVFFVLPAPEALRRCQFFTKWQLRTGESGPLLLSRRLRDGNLEREDLRLKMSTLLALVDRPYGSLNSHKLTSIKNLRIYGGSEGSLSPLLCTLGGKLALLKPAKSTSTVREKEHWVHHGSENWWVVAASQFQKVPTVVIIW